LTRQKRAPRTEPAARRTARRRNTERLGPTHREPRSALAPTKAAASLWTLPLLGLVTVGVLLRLYYLGQPMRYDESVTYTQFAAQPWATVVSSYTYPNNHVFHTVLVKVLATTLGDAAWVLRIPAFIAGTAMIPLAFALGHRLFGMGAAYIGSALVASSGALVLYSTNARGYTMVGAAVLALATVVLRLREQPSTKLWVAAVLVTAFGLWTVPIMLFPAGGVALWFALSAMQGDTKGGRADVWRGALASVVTAAVTLLLYLPILNKSGFAALAANAFVTPSTWILFFRQFVSSIEQTVGTWTLGIPAAVSVGLGFCAVIGVVNERRNAGLRVSMAGSVYVWCAFLLLVTHRAPLPRIWLFLVAPLSLVAAHGLFRVLSHFATFRQHVEPRAGAFSVVLAVALAVGVVVSRDVVTSRDTGTLRDAEAVADVLSPRLRPGDRVIAPIPSNAVLAYYFVRAGIDTSYLSSTPSDSSRLYVVVNTDEGYTLSTSLGRRALMRQFRGAQSIARYASAEVYRLY